MEHSERIKQAFREHSKVLRDQSDFVILLEPKILCLVISKQPQSNTELTFYEFLLELKLKSLIHNLFFKNYNWNVSIKGVIITFVFTSKIKRYQYLRYTVLIISYQ